MEKSTAILDVIAALRLLVGPGSFDVVNDWAAEPDMVAIALPGGDEPCVCILTAGKAPGRYDMEHGGTVFRDCLIEGLEWAVRHELRKQRQAELGAASAPKGIRRSRRRHSPRRRGR